MFFSAVHFSAADLDGLRHGGSADQPGGGSFHAAAGGGISEMQSCSFWGFGPGARGGDRLCLRETYRNVM